MVGAGRALGEGRAVEPLLERVLQAVLAREVQQAVGVEGVAGAGEVEAEVQPLLRGGGRHAVEHLLGLLERAAVLDRQALGVRARLARATGGAEASSSKLRHTSSTSSRCAKRASAASKRRLPM